MNPFLVECIKQSGLRVESWATNPPKPFQIMGSTEEVERLYEIIVNHAVECIRDEVRDPNSLLTWEQCATIQHRLRDTFGVKQ